jgi:methylmalonyl-CoA/ethylmalonyl-CoA epimerase
MLGDVIELSIVVKDLEAAIERYGKLFNTKVHKRGESKEFGFKNAILPLGNGHIEFLEPTDPNKAVGKFLAKNGEGVYLVGFECKDVPAATAHLKSQGARVSGKNDIAWVHPADAHGVFVELRHRESYS